MNAVYLMHTLFVKLKIFAGMLKNTPVFCIIHQLLHAVPVERTIVFSCARRGRQMRENAKIHPCTVLIFVKYTDFST
jgi:hypothetical protein